jgi:membrane protease YdiL (CAAX protease family)
MDEFPLISDHLLVWVFGLAVPFLSGVQSRREMDGIVFTEDIRRKFFLANSLFLAIAGAAILLHWAWRDRPFSVMGFRPNLEINHPVRTGILIAVLTVLYFADLFHAIRGAIKSGSVETALGEGTPFMPRKWRELPAYLVMCICAGVFEEVIYRGFMVTYFLPQPQDNTSLPVLAVLAPALLFSLAHGYQGWQAVGKIFLLSVLLALIFLASGSIWLVMLIHTLIDLIGGLVAIRLLRSH